MSAWITRVELVYQDNRCHHRLLFGAPLDTLTRVSRPGYTRQTALFEAGQVFGYGRWIRGRYGSRLWQVFVLQAPRPADRACIVNGIQPGAIILLHARGSAAARRALGFLNRLTQQGTPRECVSPAYYQYAHGRLAARLPVRPAADLKTSEWVS